MSAQFECVCTFVCMYVWVCVGCVFLLAGMCVFYMRVLCVFFVLRACCWRTSLNVRELNE